MKMGKKNSALILLCSLFLISGCMTSGGIQYRSSIEKMIATDDMEGIEIYAANSIDAIDKVGNTALRWAVIYDKIDMVDFLLEKGANPDIGTPLSDSEKNRLKEQGIENVNYYNPPLMIAVEHDMKDEPNKLKILESLLAAGANPNAYNGSYDGSFSAIFSAICYHNECVKLLLNYGAELSYKTKAVNSLANKIDELDVYDCIYRGSQWGGFQTDMFDVLVEEHGLQSDIITGLIYNFILVNYKIPWYSSGINHLFRHIDFITYLLDKNYDTITPVEFLLIVEFSIYIPPVMPFVGPPSAEHVRWFVDFFNAAWKESGKDLMETFKDGSFNSTIENSPQATDTGNQGRSYKAFLLRFENSVNERDNNVAAKEWLDSYGFKLE